VKALQTDLRTIGYSIKDAVGTFGDDTKRSVQKFKRHWFSFDGTATFTFPKNETLVDFETATRIVQVVSDGDTPAATPPPATKV
jgi:N-acetyl-anhydromuramyl-L-alanine amidase AmpD